MSVYGHDMWLESSSYFAEPGAELTISAENGFIFVQSENAVTPDRIITLKAVGSSNTAFEPGSGISAAFTCSRSRAGGTTVMKAIGRR